MDFGWGKAVVLDRHGNGQRLIGARRDGKPRETEPDED
jgi:hypothetical protein